MFYCSQKLIDELFLQLPSFVTASDAFERNLTLKILKMDFLSLKLQDLKKH